MTFDDLTNKAIKSAIYSKEDQTMYLIDAQRNLISCAARPHNRATFARIIGADFLSLSTIVSVLPKSVVKHEVARPEKNHQFCSRQYDFLTDGGACTIMIAMEGWHESDRLRLECEPTVGYPADDATHLEDTNVS